MSLQVLGGVAPGQEREQLDGAAQREVGEPREHPDVLQVGGEAQPDRARVPRTGSSTGISEFPHPTRYRAVFTDAAIESTWTAGDQGRPTGTLTE